MCHKISQNANEKNVKKEMGISNGKRISGRPKLTKSYTKRANKIGGKKKESINSKYDSWYGKNGRKEKRNMCTSEKRRTFLNWNEAEVDIKQRLHFVVGDFYTNNKQPKP